MVLTVKNLLASAGDIRNSSSVLGSGRSPGEENGYPLQYSCLENSVDRGSWRATVRGFAESDTIEWLSYTHTYTHTSPTADKCTL